MRGIRALAMSLILDPIYKKYTRRSLAYHEAL
jgi:hypothetical protein